MTQNNKQYKCPYCACLFLTKADLDKHVSIFGKIKEQHDALYKKTHGRLEHGFSEE